MKKMKPANVINRMMNIMLVLAMMLTLGACGARSQSHKEGQISFDDLKKTGSMELSYATQFQVDEYGQYSLIQISGENSFLVVPQGAEVPTDLPEGVTVLQQPLDKTYLVSTSVMDLVCRIERLSCVKMSGTKAEDWYVDEAREAMEVSDILYAGKYSAPDYEQILAEGCNLAIENTMIYHTPEVKEKLEELGIPVLVERSSYETHPLGRLEWIKLYGVLFDARDAADEYYERELEVAEPLMSQENTGKSVAFFYVNSSGAINVRKPNDYISKMISMSGGNYVLSDAAPEEENALSTMNMQMEDFYLAASDADILIYNSVIEGELKDVDELISKNSLFAEFKAVKEGNVYCTGKNFFQQTTQMAEFMEEMNAVFTGNDMEMTYLKRLR